MNYLRVVALLFCIMITPSFLQSSVHAAAVQLPQTGQNLCYNTSGTAIDCANTGQDGAFKKGVAWPDPRFTDNNDGTVTDNLTGLVWLKNANCSDTVGGIAKINLYYLLWHDALTWSNNLASGTCGLTDGSVAGDWRLPNRRELSSLVDRQNLDPALPTVHPFLNVGTSNGYLTSSSYEFYPLYAYYVQMSNGMLGNSNKFGGGFVWPVRDGQ